MSLKVCVWGEGAREEALRSAVSKSHLCSEIITNPDDADLIIFGPEAPICEGLVDFYEEKGIKCIGVNKKFSKLESSKLFAKLFMANNGIKCAKLLPLECDSFPQVVKFDGLCKGKGVKVVYSREDKDAFTRKILNSNVDSGVCKKYFIEEFLQGEEVSLMSFFNGKKLINFAPARDFKRLSADKNSPNTGGMGAFCPVALSAIQQKRLNMYQEKLEAALLAEGADFCGFVYSGLIWTADDWYVLEYNVRLGDPEIQAILSHLKSDFLEILLEDKQPEYKSGVGACLVIASEGYPEKPFCGDEIVLPSSTEDIDVYFAGVEFEDGKIFSNGGRVLSLCTNSQDPFPVLKDYAEKISMEHKYFRKDIDIK